MSSRQSDDEETLNRALARLVSWFGRDRVRKAQLGQTCGPGRPPNRVRSLEFEMLASSIDEIANTFASQGHKHPMTAAFTEAAELERKPVETIQRYYRRGCEGLRDRDNRLAAGFDVLTRELTTTKANDAPVRLLALERLAKEEGLTPWIIDRAVKRATKRHRGKKRN